MTTDRIASHTPGPWTIEDPMTFELAIVEAGKTAAEWGFVACLPFKDKKDPTDNDFPDEVVHANARLIAAAPDLLKLAREYAGACINCGGSAEIIRNKSSDGDPLHDFAEPCPECEHIRSAIAKAEGRS